MNIVTNKQNIFVAMSGGVDSSVVAAILKSTGYNVSGIYMKNWSGEDFGIQADCPWEKDVEDVKEVCEKIGIEMKIYNFEKEYREQVVNYFFDEYKKGRTPNPDILCNSKIKFGTFLERAISEGADMIATGHYARVEQIDKKYQLLKGLDQNKDQSYFLSDLDQYQLSKTLFPIGHLQKSEVRKLAEEFKLPVAEKKDSQGICFIGDINVAKFLRSNISYKPGVILDEDTGLQVGEHDGVAFYTIGQREGLSKIKVTSPTQKPYFVSNKDTGKNILYVVQGSDNLKLYKNSCKLQNIHFINKNIESVIASKAKQSEFESNFILSLEVAIRYRAKVVKSSLNLETKELDFSEPVRGISSGQSAVFYQGEVCLGRGVVE